MNKTVTPNDWSHNHHNRIRNTRQPRPAAKQPGTLRQQLVAVELYLQNPWPLPPGDHRWQASRRTIMQHARRPE